MADTGNNKNNGETSVKRPSCAYCDLPVTSTRAGDDSEKDASSTGDLYCCYGCRFAHAVIQEQAESGAVRWTVVRLGLAIFFTMNLMAFTMTMWSLDVYDVQPDPFQLKLFEVFRWLSMLFALPVVLLLGIPLIDNAVDSWKRRDFSTDLLIGFAVCAAYVTSVVNVVRGDGSIYFEVGAMVLVMITLGRWIEAAGKQKATAALDRLAALLPTSVRRIDRATNVTSDVLCSSIEKRDLLRIRAGERFPTDATLHLGRTTVDEQVYTGESHPISKDIGDNVFAGTINLDGDIVVSATELYRQGSFGRLMDTLQQARLSRSRYQRLADRISAWFFTVVTFIALASFIAHWSSGAGTAIQTAMSVLLIACPCALGLATPLAIWTSLSTAAKHHVLFRNGEAIERLANAKAFCLDKTGTLTTGQPRVSQFAILEVENGLMGEEPQRAANTLRPHIVLEIAHELAQSSTHPFSKAIVQYVRQTSDKNAQLSAVPTKNLKSIRTVPGGGIQAESSDGRSVRMGSVEFACCESHATEQSERDCIPHLCVSCNAAVPLRQRIQLDRLRMAADQQAASIVLLTIDRKPVAGFLIAESLRKETRPAILQLRNRIDALHVLSGDRAAKGESLREAIRVPGITIECRLSPERKVQRVNEIRRQFGTTVMVGDGINDAPALAASDVGIAMGCGADVSRDSAEVCLLSDDLRRLPWAVALARRTTSVIRQNLFWAFGYNAVGVGVAAAGLLNPAVAAGLMIGSSLLVISNSLRLLNQENNNDKYSHQDKTPTVGSSPFDVATKRPNEAAFSYDQQSRDVEVTT